MADIILTIPSLAPDDHDDQKFRGLDCHKCQRCYSLFQLPSHDTRTPEKRQPRETTRFRHTILRVYDNLKRAQLRCRLSRPPPSSQSLRYDHDGSAWSTLQEAGPCACTVPDRLTMLRTIDSTLIFAVGHRRSPERSRQHDPNFRGPVRSHDRGAEVAGGCRTDHRVLTTRTEQGACRATRRDTLPRNAPLKPVMPRDPRITRSAWLRVAAWMISSAAWPSASTG